MLRPLAAVIAVTAVTGCHAQAGNDGGSTVSKNYNVGNFSAIEVAGPYDVEVRTGANPSVSARGSRLRRSRSIRITSPTFCTPQARPAAPRAFKFRTAP